MRRTTFRTVDGREIVRLLPETPADVITIREAEKNGAELANFSLGDQTPGEKPDQVESEGSYE